MPAARMPLPCRISHKMPVPQPKSRLVLGRMPRRSSQVSGVIDSAVQGFPLEGCALQGHVTVGAAGFGDGYGAGVCVQISGAEGFPGGDVGVSMEQDIPWLQRR